MTKYGIVSAIIDGNYLLVEISDDVKLPDNNILMVYREIQNTKLLDETSLEVLRIPLGKIQIIQFQSDKLYLAKLYEISRQTKVVYKNDAYNNVLSSILRPLGSPSYVEEITHAGQLNPEEAIGLSIKETISKGDYVGVN